MELDLRKGLPAFYNIVYPFPKHSHECGVFVCVCVCKSEASQDVSPRTDLKGCWGSLAGDRAAPRSSSCLPLPERWAQVRWSRLVSTSGLEGEGLWLSSLLFFGRGSKPWPGRL